MALYQHASDAVDGKAYSGVISGGKWIACEADSEEWDAYVVWAAEEGNVTDPYKHPAEGGETITLEEGEVAYGAMLASMPDAPLPPPGPPENVDVPAVMPLAATVGETLTCTMGNWKGEPVSYGWRWFRDLSADLGTGETYVVTEADVGHSVTCTVSASSPQGTAQAPPSNAVLVSAAARAEVARTAAPAHAPVARVTPDKEPGPAPHTRGR